MALRAFSAPPRVPCLNRSRASTTPSYPVASTSKGVPAEGLEPPADVRHGEHEGTRVVQLALVLVHKDAQFVQMPRARVHHPFPDHSRLELSVAGQVKHVESLVKTAAEGETDRDRQSVALGPRGDMNARQQGTRMPVEDALGASGMGEPVLPVPYRSP
jgi:hypothetical protein